MLTGHEIRRQVADSRIEIEPFNESQLNPNSYDLRLGDRLLIYSKARINLEERRLGREPISVMEPLDMRVEESTEELAIPPDGLVLYPGILYLGSTVETTFTPLHIPLIEGKSSIGRLGIQVHLTAGFGDIYFRGDWTLEILVAHPVRVYAGVRICQIAYQSPEGRRMPYAGRYQNQRGPKPSGLWRDFADKQVRP